MTKWILSALCLLTITTSVFANKYPTCVNAKAVPSLADIKQKVVLCPHGYITASVMPRIKYHNFAIPYNNYCKDIKLTFSTKSANVLIDDWQYYTANVTIYGYKPKGRVQIPDISTGNNRGIVKITNDSNTSVCIGEQCLYG